jgi:hypothetical protein
LALFGVLIMVDAGNVLGVLAAVLLFMAVTAWVKLIRGPLKQRTDGCTGMDPADNGFASELLIWAAGLSTAAMFLAVAGRIFG